MKRSLLVVIFSLAMLNGYSQFLGGYQFRNSITIQGSQVAGAETDFPVLISITGADFTGNLEGNVSSASGFDIAFTADNGTTLLDHELVEYDETTDTFSAWVKTSLTGSDQVIFIYYGNPSITTDQSTTDTWSNGFEVVFHMEDITISDASANGITAVALADITVADEVSGQIGGGINLDGGSNDYIVVGAVNAVPANLDLTNQALTLSGWVNYQGASTEVSIIEKSNGTGDANIKYYLGVDDNDANGMQVRTATTDGNGRAQGSTNIQNTWHYITMTYDGTVMLGYLDGNLEVGPIGRTGNLESDTGDDFLIGRRADNRRLDALIDELRVATQVRSSNWITTEFNNQSDPSTFISLGTQEGNCSPAAVITNSTPSTTITTGEQAIFTLTAAAGVLDGSNVITWQESSDGLTYTNVVDGVNGASGASTSSFTSGTLTNDTYFRVVVTNLSDCDITGTSNAIMIATVAPFPVSLSTYSNRREITINALEVIGDNGDTQDHTDFPILVSFTNNDFRSVSNGGSVMSENGYDILFTSSDGSTVLSHELEKYDPATGTVYAWVEVNNLQATTDTEIYIYYGNGDITSDQSSTDTWSNGFAGVWHMNEDPSVTSIFDATSNSNEARPLNMESDDLVSGKIGNGIDMDGFDGSAGEFFVVGADNNVPAALDISGQNITLTGWVNPSAVNTSQFSIIEKSNSNQDVDIPYWLGRNGDNVQARVGTPETAGNNLRLDGNTNFSTGTWYYISMTYDGTVSGTDNFFAHVNAQIEDQDERTGNIIDDDSDELFLGGRDDNTNRFFDGIVDELRIATVTRTREWLETEYRNQCFPSQFISLGDGQTCPDPVNGGIATATDGSIFIGESTTVVLSGNTNGADIQWQTSTDKINFSNVSGANAQQLAVGPLSQSTYYRAEVTNGTCTAYSTVTTIKAVEPILPGYSFRKCITINGDLVEGSSDLTNFPIVIDIRNDPDLSTDNIRTISGVNPLDIVFSVVNGSSQQLITHEVEFFESDATDGSIRAWVQVPSLSANSDTKIFMNYGNCNVTEVAGSSVALDNGTSVTNPTNTNTWSEGFLSVWHMDDDVSNTGSNATVEDATNTNADGTAQANMTTITGQVGDGLDFAGSGNRYLLVGSLDNPPAALENIGSAFTLSAWLRANNNNPNDRSIIELSDGTGATDTKYFLGVDGEGIQVRAVDTESDNINENAGGGFSSSVDDDVWHYIVASYDGSQIDTYIDGANLGTFTAANFGGNIGSEAGDELLIGKRNDNRFISAFLDELRISNVTRADEWIATEYNNQSEPTYDFNDLANASDFYSVSSEESFVLWTDAGSGSNWSTANNWGICRTPNPDETVRIADPADIQGSNNPTFDAASDGATIGGILIENNGALNFENTGFSLSVTGDITNNSGSGFVADGTITFSGANQSIQGTGATTITNATVINGATVNIDAPTTITNNLTLTSGFISLTDDNLSITSTGQILNASSSNFIITPFENCLIQEGMGNGGITSSVLFPIGTTASSYTPATLANSSSGTIDNFCVYVCENIFEEGTCASGTPMTTGAVHKTWFIEETVTGGSDATLTLQWNGADEASDFDRANVNLSRNVSSSWVSRNLTSASGSDPYTASASGLSEFSPHGLISDVSLLPVSLTFFNASLIQESVELKWQTATEINNDKFIVQRSRNAIDYEKLGEVSGAGNSSTTLNYSYNDRAPLAGLTYYRLIQVDFDGTETVYGPVSIEMDGKHNQKLFPNPASQYINIRFDDRFIDTDVSIKLFSIDGHMVQTMNTRANFTEFRLDFGAQLSNGLYFLQVENQNLTIGQKIIIQKN